MPDDLEDVPLARRLPPERLLRREGAQERRALGDLAFEAFHDMPAGDELDVLKVVRQALVGVRASGAGVGIGHPERDAMRGPPPPSTGRATDPSATRQPASSRAARGTHPAHTRASPFSSSSSSLVLKRRFDQLTPMDDV